MAADSPVIVALDCDAAEALSIAHALRGRVMWLKVGMTLYYAEGPGIVARLRELGFEVFVDLKLHDIPHQVAGAAASIARSGAAMMTVHASGGREMMRSAVESARHAAEQVGARPPAVVAVTVLTSADDAGLTEIGIERDATDQVLLLGALAREAGVDGVVCSPKEAALMRELLGSDSFIVTPGVRPAWAENQDQARVATPLEALAAGATHLVIGRPITGAADPANAADRIIFEIEKGGL